MQEYIKENKKAWEEAFDLRDVAYCADMEETLNYEVYPYFEKEMVDTLKKYDLKDKTIGQFCCNNGRELLSLVNTTKAKKGIGFDLAENMVHFANEMAIKLNTPCDFVQTNILDIDNTYENIFDMVIITVGALYWFDCLNDFFAVISRCMKKGGIIVINEMHPFENMLAMKGEKQFDKAYPLNSVYSYFKHEWVENDGMYYMTKKRYESKTFTGFTHSISEIVSSMCTHDILITNMQEFEKDISGNFAELDYKGFPLTILLEGKKE